MKLMVCVPTVDRCYILRQWLDYHLHLFAKYDVLLHIHNNGSTDKTDQVLSQYKEKYKLISTSYSEKKEVYDVSVFKCLSNNFADYKWLIGDTYRIDEKVLSRVLEICKFKNRDFILLNIANKIKKYKEDIDITEHNFALEHYSGLAASISTVIIHQKILEDFPFKHYIGTRYMHTAILYHYIGFNRFSGVFLPNLNIQMLPLINAKKINWAHGDESLKIITDCWLTLVLSLPNSFNLYSKLNSSKNVGIITNLFSLKGFLLMRSRGAISFLEILRLKKSLFICLTPKLYFIAIIASLIPVSFLSFFYKIKFNE